LNSRNGRELAEEDREVVLGVLGVDRARVIDPLPTITHIVDDIESVLDDRLGPNKRNTYKCIRLMDRL
jgi:hypothetical protein